jgi:hypothetical protein
MSPVSVDRRHARSNTSPDNTSPDNTAPDWPPENRRADATFR